MELLLQHFLMIFSESKQEEDVLVLHHTVTACSDSMKFGLTQSVLLSKRLTNTIITRDAFNFDSEIEQNLIVLCNVAGLCGTETRMDKSKLHVLHDR